MESRPLASTASPGNLIGQRRLLGDGAIYRDTTGNVSTNLPPERQVELFDGTVLDLPSMWNQNRPFTFDLTQPGSNSRNYRPVGAIDNTILLGPAFFDIEGEAADFLLLSRSDKPALHVECVGSRGSVDDFGLRVFPFFNAPLEFRIRGGVAGHQVALIPVVEGMDLAPLPISIGRLDSTGGFSVSIPNGTRSFTIGLRAIALDPEFGVIQSPVMRLKVGT